MTENHSLFNETLVTDVSLDVVHVAAAVLADVELARGAQPPAVEDEAEHLAAADAAVLVELLLSRQDGRLLLLLLDDIFDQTENTSENGIYNSRHA